MTHVLRRAVTGIELLPVQREFLELTPEITELFDPRVDLLGVFLDHGEDVLTGRLSAFTETEDFPDLREGETDRLRRPHEAEAFDDVGAVVAVAVGTALRCVDEPDVLVVTERLLRQPGAQRELADPHTHSLGG